MYYCYDLGQAREAHGQHGGVLLEWDDMYIVCRFNDAVELRCDEAASPCDLATYWAAMAECEYDETEPLVRRVKARLAGTEAALPLWTSHPAE